jgi:hypothetical protein
MHPDPIRRVAAALVGALALAAVLAVGGCGGDDDEPERWPGPGEGLGRLDVAAFNEYAEEADETWRRAPALTASEFARVDTAEARVTTVAATTGPEGGPRATATVTLDGLLDDSVRARRYVLGLTRDDDGDWQLESALATQRCWPRRGHQGFAPTACN